MSWQPGPYGNNPQPQQPPAQQGFPEFQPGGPPAGPPPGPYGPGGPVGYGPPPKRGGSGTIVILVVVIAVFVVAGLGTGAYFLFFRKSSGTTASDPGQAANANPSPSTSAGAVAQPLWEARTPKGWDSSRETTMVGSWIGDQVVVRGQRDSVVAYNLSDGKPAWQVPAEGIGFCGMSASTREGVGYVSYGRRTGDDITCTNLLAIEVSTGKHRWDVDVASGEQYPPEEGDGERPEVFGDVVATAADGGAVRTLEGFDAASGKPRWTFYGTDSNPLGTGDCALQDRRVAKDVLLVVAGCAPQPRTFGQDQAVVFAIEPATGKPRWATPIPTELVATGDAHYVTLVGTDHPAISVRAGGETKKDVVVGLDPATGKLGTPIPTTGLELALTANGTPRMMGTVTVAPTVSNESTLFMLANTNETLRAEGDGIGSCVSPTGLVAFDLKQGKALWDKPAALSCSLSIVGFDKDNLLVLNGGGPGDETPPKLMAVDPSGKATPVKELGAPRIEDRVRELYPGPAYYQNEQVVLVPENPSRLFPYFALGLSAK